MTPPPSRPPSPRPFALPSIFSPDTRRAQTIPLDPALLTAIDEEAGRIGAELEALMRALRGKMETAMSTTALASEIHRDAAASLAAAVADSTARVEAFIDAVEALDAEMGSIAALGKRIKSIDALLDSLLAAVPPMPKR